MTATADSGNASANSIRRISKFKFGKGFAMWKKAIFCLMSLLSLALSACNTVEGAGRDVEHLGRDIHDEAQEHKHY